MLTNNTLSTHSKEMLPIETQKLSWFRFKKWTNNEAVNQVYASRNQ